MHPTSGYTRDRAGQKRLKNDFGDERETAFFAVGARPKTLSNPFRIRGGEI
jgi:hypothetical protein